MAEPDRFSECCAVDDDRRIRQGDVFIWLEPGTDPWVKRGVIVTADCDIAHDKHRGILSYVPLLELRDYLALFHLPTKVEKACVPIREQLVKTIRQLQTEYAPNFPRLVSEDAALRWVRTATGQGIADELTIPPGKDREQFLRLANDYVATEADLRDGSFHALLKALVRTRRQSGSSKEQTITKFWSDTRTLVENLPGDAFFIGSAGPEHGGGHIGYLRLVREIHQSAIAIKQTDLRDSSVHARRIAALTSPYIYRLTQQLAEVFAAIGLPREYEDARKEILARVADGSM